MHSSASVSCIHPSFPSRLERRPKANPVGREDTFTDSSEKCVTSPREVRTTGWVSLRFTPRPTGIRWLLSSHPLPPLLLLPPISLTLTLSSSLIAFMIISYVSKSPKGSAKKLEGETEKTTEEKLLDERRASAARDREDREEEERLRAEWEEVQERSSGGLRRIPEERKRSRVGESTVGGVSIMDCFLTPKEEKLIR